MREDTYENGVFWLAWDGDTAVGYCGVYTGIKNETWLVRVGVLREYRRLGLGRRLVQTRLRWWLDHPELGGDTLRTYVADWNIGSIKNVLRAGLFPYRALQGWIYFERRRVQT